MRCFSLQSCFPSLSPSPSTARQRVKQFTSDQSTCPLGDVRHAQRAHHVRDALDERRVVHGEHSTAMVFRLLLRCSSESVHFGSLLPLYRVSLNTWRGDFREVLAYHGQPSQGEHDERCRPSWSGKRTQGGWVFVTRASVGRCTCSIGRSSEVLRTGRGRYVSTWSSWPRSAVSTTSAVSSTVPLGTC